MNKTSRSLDIIYSARKMFTSICTFKIIMSGSRKYTMLNKNKQ